MNSLISIITVAYNSEATIRQTIESVLHQTYDRIEYLIIDGGSADSTLQIAEEYRERMQQRGYAYFIISEPDRGIYDAMNKGIGMAQGELIGMINSDDWYEPIAVQRAAETYEKSGCDMLYADLRIWSCRQDGTLQEKMIKRAKLRKLAVSRDWNHPTTFITRKTYDRFRYKVESLHDDWDLVLRIRRTGLKTVIISEVLANFRMNGASHEKNIRKSIDRAKARYHIYRSNGYSRWYFWECLLIELAKWIAG